MDQTKQPKEELKNNTKYRSLIKTCIKNKNIMRRNWMPKRTLAEHNHIYIYIYI